MFDFEEPFVLDEYILKFKNRKIKANEIFYIDKIEKNVAYQFIKENHYLGDAKFFSKFSYGVFYNNTLIGCAVYSNPQGISSLKGWFGLGNDDQTVMELHRLCVLQEFNGTNLTSYLLGNSIKLLKKENIKAVITLADANRHVGSIYQVCNFKYYGLTDKKTDFYTEDGRVNPRGETKNLKGVWIPRTRKHRYCYLIDNKMKVLLTEQSKPSSDSIVSRICCNGKLEVYDNRYGKKYKCPICCDEQSLIILDD